MSETENKLPQLAFHAPVIACGGVGGLAPRNTLAALRKARDEGVFWVCLDVKLTQDGVPVVLRDDDLSLSLDAQGLVQDTNWSDLRQMKLGAKGGDAFAGEGIPSLTEAMGIVVEKSLFPVLWLRPSHGRSRVTTMVALIEMAKVWPEENDSPLILSEDVDSLIVAAQLLPQWHRGLLFPEWCHDWKEEVHRVDASVIGMHEKALLPDRVEVLRAHDLPVLAYGVEDPQKAKGLLASGVTALLSDRAREVLAQIH